MVRTQTCISSCTHGLFHRGACRTLLHDGATNHFLTHASQHAHCTLHRSGLDAIDLESARARASRRGRARIATEQRSHFDLAAVGLLSLHPSAIVLCDIVCLCACRGLTCLSLLFFGDIKSMHPGGEISISLVYGQVNYSKG